ncbi:MAG: hypothetical protein F6K04_13590 [Leptolyngbya sp. SIO4C5]|nr:hypothetical protein [Leptolyngbya sp. SIO4C5]
MASSVKLELQQREIDFKPSDTGDFTRAAPATESDLAVTVINTTDRFASFQLALEASGVEPTASAQWYTVEPEICAKKPPGDRTQFHITMLKAPIPAYDTQLPLTLKILSPEIEQISTTETVFLRILRPNKTLRVYLPFQDLQVYPGDRVRIPALVYNLSSETKNITLKLTGLDATPGWQTDWFPEGTERSLRLGSGSSEDVTFWCVPPATAQTESRLYHLGLEASDGQGNTASTAGRLEVLPFGSVSFQCLNPRQQVPAQSSGGVRQRLYPVAYDLIFSNQSNLLQQIQLSVQSSYGSRWQTVPATLELAPEVSGGLRLDVESQRPWLGTTRTRFFEVFPQLASPGSGEVGKAVKVSPASRILELRLKPVVPLWLQVLGGLVGLWLLWLAWWLNPETQHTAPINSISLFASGDTIFSGSSDQTVRRWQVNQDPWIIDIRRPKFQRVMATGEAQKTAAKPIRVIQHLPEESVAQIAIGLEDGEIQLWNIDPPNRLQTFRASSGPDRIFDLDFTSDSRFLFSGHGSGRVHQWRLQTADPAAQPEVEKTLSLGGDYAVSSLSVSERPGYNLLVIGGQFNRLMVWDYERQSAYNLAYKRDRVFAEGIEPVTNRNSYITSTAAAAKSAVLATADNQGVITTWNLETIRDCLPQTFKAERSARFLQEDCQTEFRLDQWQAGEISSPVRALELSSNGCYLASTGDDGRVMLWPLTADGSRDSRYEAGIAVRRFNDTRLNSVDLHYTTEGQQEVVLVASDTPGNRVQLYRKQLNPNGCQ